MAVVVVAAAVACPFTLFSRLPGQTWEELLEVAPARLRRCVEAAQSAQMGLTCCHTQVRCRGTIAYQCTPIDPLMHAALELTAADDQRLHDDAMRG
jgi:hypothetical protein